MGPGPRQPVLDEEEEEDEDDEPVVIRQLHQHLYHYLADQIRQLDPGARESQLKCMMVAQHAQNKAKQRKLVNP